MSKPFFYRINAADLLADAVEIEDDAERGKWIVRLAMDLVRADFDTAKSSTAKAMIEETEIFRNKKAEAGRKGGSAKAKASSAKAALSSAVAKPSIPLASSSSSSSSSTELLITKEGIYGIGDNVNLTGIQCQKLIDKIGHEVTIEYIDKLSTWDKVSTVKDFYLTILKWWANDGKPQPKKTDSTEAEANRASQEHAMQLKKEFGF